MHFVLDPIGARMTQICVSSFLKNEEIVRLLPLNIFLVKKYQDYVNFTISLEEENSKNFVHRLIAKVKSNLFG